MSTKKTKIVDSVFERLEKVIGEDGAYIAFILEEENGGLCRVKGSMGDPYNMIKAITAICLEDSYRSQVVFMLMANAVTGACMVSDERKRLMARIRAKHKRLYREFKEGRHEKGDSTD